MAEQRTNDSGGYAFAILAIFLSASGWSILLRARTVGNLMSTNALTTVWTVSGDQVSRGVFSEMWSRV